MNDVTKPVQSGQDVLIPELISFQAGKHPEAIAMVSGAKTVTYGELVRRSRQFANYLRGMGVGPEKLVAVAVKRSPEMVIAALGTLEAGGAYLPTDPSMPAERTLTLLRDANVAVLVTDPTTRELAASLPSVRHVDVEKDAGAVAGSSSDAVEPGITSDSLAYVIYTSGSTGQPKGVELTHGGLANLVRWHLRAFQVTSADRASHLAALGFDAAVWELWPYLAAGASVYLAEDSVRNNPEALRDWLVREKITVSFLATPLAERMMQFSWPRPSDLRLLLTGADTLHRRPGAGLPFLLVNNYGPTECTVVATSGTVMPSSTEPISIGQAIDGMQAYVLNETMQRVPAGTAGELYVGGAGLARGYRNLPEMTAQKFVANPFVAGERLYRTGDMVRALPSGGLEFLGRLDSQIKIRGYRIEPNEIIRALDACPDIEASAVIAAEDEAGDRRLVAYVVLKNGTSPTASELRSVLRGPLPDYMIPAAFVRLETLPVTSNGKVDVAALPAAQRSNMLEEERYVAPETMVEQRLAAIIAPLLRVERVGVHDNFFFMGGHSLLGTQLISRISESFGVELSLLSLFEHPTLAEMSSEIEKLILAKVGAESERYASSGARTGDAA